MSGWRDLEPIDCEFWRGAFRGLQEGTHGRMVPVYRVPAWRRPNEDGSNRDAMYRPYRGSAPHFWDGHFRRADQMTAAEIRDLLGL